MIHLLQLVRMWAKWRFTLYESVKVMTNPSIILRLRTWFRALVEYDFAPKFSAKVRWFVYHPLGVLTIAAFTSFLCGLFIHSQGFVLSGGFKYNPTLIFDLARTTTSMGMGSVGGNNYL